MLRFRLQRCISSSLLFSAIVCQAGFSQQRSARPVRAPVVLQSRIPGAPDWFPLSAEQQKHLDDVLNYWEHRSSEVKTYSCRIERWEYGGLFSAPDVYHTYSTGVLKYASPDKGLFSVQKASHIKRPLKPGTEPTYTELSDVQGEHWVCDGQSVFEFDANQKRVIQRALPPHMRGRDIVDGPFPFLFGAKAATIKQRYWIRAILPSPQPKKFWLEAVPKHKEDAANARKLNVIIDEESFLPEGLILHHRDDSKTTFRFVNREVNKKELLERINIFHREFFEPKTPLGWERVIEPIHH